LLTGLETRKLKMKISADLSGERTFLINSRLLTATFVVKGSLTTFIIRALIPLVRALSLGPDHFLKT
jgi:hypothetical protein